MANSEFIKKQLEIAVEALRRVGAVVEFCPESLRIMVISDTVELDIKDDKMKMLVDGNEITDSVGMVMFRAVNNEYPDIKAAFKPKITIRKVRKS